MADDLKMSTCRPSGRTATIIFRLNEPIRGRIMLLDQIASEPVGVCVSGGLSSLAVAASLADSGVVTTALVADIGQASDDDVHSLARSLEGAGIPVVAVDLRDAMAELALDLVRYLARHERGYWNTTSSSRLVLVQGLAAAARG